jgi:predicted SnoaL-like aldol condensation-catalyzing enzyme
MRKLLWASLIVLFTAAAVAQPAGRETTANKAVVEGGPFTELAKSCPMCAALVQRKIVIGVMIAESDLVSVRSTWSGLYTGTTRGVSFHLKPVTLVYFHIYRVSGGRIRENWAEYDRMSMAEQLGFQVTSPWNPQ